jgi:acetyl-CoA C-acetyltransferase
MSREARSVEEIATPTERNRMLSDPFPRFVVSRDQANQAAAVILTSVGRARALGVPEDRWVYLHGHADAKERMVMDRQDMGAYPAAVAAAKQALGQAGITAADLGVIDFYSCFPVAVFGLCDGLGISPTDPRGLTVTGGLPFFGGAGNNYSMHALAEVIGALRARPGQFGFVGANGGFLSKYSAGVYSTRPAHYQPDDSKALQAEIDGWAAPEVVEEPEGEGVVETYTIDYQGAGEPKPVIVGRLANGARFMAAAAPGSAEVQIMLNEDPLGRAVRVTKAADPAKGMNLFTFA